jgi:hypothetical protein
MYLYQTYDNFEAIIHIQISDSKFPNQIKDGIDHNLFFYVFVAHPKPSLKEIVSLL